MDIWALSSEWRETHYHSLLDFGNDITVVCYYISGDYLISDSFPPLMQCEAVLLATYLAQPGISIKICCHTAWCSETPHLASLHATWLLKCITNNALSAASHQLRVPYRGQHINVGFQLVPTTEQIIKGSKLIEWVQKSHETKANTNLIKAIHVIQ